MRIYSTDAKAVPITTGNTKTGSYAQPVNTTADGKSQTVKAQCEKTSVANIVAYSSTYGASGVAERVPDECVVMPDECLRVKEATTNVHIGTTKYHVYEVKDGMITVKGKRYPIKLVDGYYIIRKLTVTECMRLQTVPEWYEFPVSKSQAYKMLGNGWTVEVIKHLISSAMSDGKEKHE